MMETVRDRRHRMAREDGFLSPLLFFVPWAGFASTLTRRTGLPAGAAWLTAAAGALCGGLVIGCVAGVAAAQVAVWGAGLALLAAELRAGGVGPRRLAGAPATWVILAAAGAVAAVHGETAFLYWDEFDQWGLLPKELLGTGRVLRSSSNAIRPYEVPGTAVWYALVLAPTGFREGGCYVANAMLWAASLAPVADLAPDSRRDPPAAGLAVALVVGLAAVAVAIGVLGMGPVSLYAEPLIAAMFTGVTLVAIRGAPPVIAAVLAAALTSLKGVGLCFALAAAGIGGGRGRWRAAGAAALAAVGTHLAWRVVIRRAIPPPAVETVATKQGLVETLAQLGGPARFPETTARFREVAWGQPLRFRRYRQVANEFRYADYPGAAAEGGLGLVGWLLVGLGLTALRVLAAPAASRPARAVRAGLLAGTSIAYLGALVVCYRVGAFGAASPDLPSFLRYVAVAVVPLVLVPLAGMLADGGRWGYRVAPGLALALVFFEAPDPAVWLTPRHAGDARRFLRDAPMPPGDGPVVVVLPEGLPGVVRWWAIFEVTPRPVARVLRRAGAPYRIYPEGSVPPGLAAGRGAGAVPSNEPHPSERTSGAARSKVISGVAATTSR